MIVLDASAALEWLLRTPRSPAVAARLLADPAIAAPHLMDVEVAQVLRRLAMSRAIDTKTGAMALADLASAPLTRYPHTPFLPRMWELRDNLTAYDAAYIALAEVLDAPLLTCDGRLASVAGHRAVVELI